MISIVSVPVVSKLSGEARLAFIKREWAVMPWELRRDPMYAMSFRYLDRKVEA